MVTATAATPAGMTMRHGSPFVQSAPATQR